MNPFMLLSDSLLAQMVKNPQAMRETWLQSLGWEDPLEKGTATHSRILAWRIPDRGAWKSEFPGGSDGKESACNVGDLGLIFGLGRSPGGGNSYPLPYSGLESSMDCIVHGIAESDTTE